MKQCILSSYTFYNKYNIMCVLLIGCVVSLEVFSWCLIFVKLYSIIYGPLGFFM